MSKNNNRIPRAALLIGVVSAAGLWYLSSTFSSRQAFNRQDSHCMENNVEIRKNKNQSNTPSEGVLREVLPNLPATSVGKSLQELQKDSHSIENNLEVQKNKNKSDTLSEGILSLREVLSKAPATSVSPSLKELHRFLKSKTKGTPAELRLVENWWGQLASGSSKNCSKLERIGGKRSTNVQGRDDGGKWMCTDYPFKVVYSLGSNGDFTFEAEIAKRFGISVYTFDCTIGNKKFIVPDGVHFYPWCLGGKDEQKSLGGTAKHQFYSLNTIMSKLQHEKVDVLKMDIEGSEFEIFRDLTPLPVESLPKQILFELHLEAWLLGENIRLREPTDIILFPLFSESKYKVFHIEPNIISPHCCEYSVLL